MTIEMSCPAAPVGRMVRVPVPGIVESALKAPKGLGVRSFLLSGPAGTGKTSLTRQVADDIEAAYVFIQCCPGMGETELIYTVLPTANPDSKSGVKIVEGKMIEALRASIKGRVVLVLDEWDKTRPTADAFLLDFLQNARVSWRIGESMIAGKAENLVVFMTSNAERDFSEPLLRRCIVVEMHHMNAAEMRAALEGYGCCNEHLPILVQLYQDTINAGLDKPATVQELVDLEQMIHQMGDQADFQALVFSCVVKTRDAMELLEKHVSSRPSLPPKQEPNAAFVSAYEEEIKPVLVSDAPPARMPKIKVKQPVPALVTRAIIVEEGSEQEVHARVNNAEDAGMTAIVKAIVPSPGNDPARVGSFTVAMDGAEPVLVATEPITLDELNILGDKKVEGEFHAVGFVPASEKFVTDLLVKLARRGCKEGPAQRDRRFHYQKQTYRYFRGGFRWR